MLGRRKHSLSSLPIRTRDRENKVGINDYLLLILRPSGASSGACQHTHSPSSLQLIEDPVFIYVCACMCVCVCVFVCDIGQTSETVCRGHSHVCSCHSHVCDLCAEVTPTFVHV